MEAEPVQKVGGPDEAAAQGAVQLVYVLQSVGMIFGITWIAGVVVNYVKLDQARGTWLESHFRWQMRSFWFGLLWHVLGVLTVWIFVGFAILTAAYIWLIYRVVKGWLNLNDKKPMYQ